MGVKDKGGMAILYSCGAELPMNDLSRRIGLRKRLLSQGEEEDDGQKQARRAEQTMHIIHKITRRQALLYRHRQAEDIHDRCKP
jgi:hypothetical protein